MGVTISAPSPKFPVETSKPFNPATQKSEDAFSGNEPRFPTTSSASIKWHPAKPSEKEGVIAKEQWDVVSTRWHESSKNEETVRQWRNAFSWKATLAAKAPHRFKEEFGELYMAAPMLTVG